MLKIESITIKEFRGIRDLTLNFKKQSFGICGPNGTGKSGVVDAIEFALRGDVTRLSGQGSGDLSVGKHGPHVDAGEKSENASVRIKAHLYAIGKDVEIYRSVASPQTAVVEPTDDDVVSAVEELVRHPEFALSRREIAKYIMTPATQRATDVQNLLRLSEIDKIRKALTAAMGTEKRAMDAASRSLLDARQDLARSLDLEEIDPSQILDAANQRRSILKLEPIEELNEGTKLAEGIEQDGENGEQVSKRIFSERISSAIEFTTGLDADTSERRTDLVEALTQLRDDAEAFSTLRRKKLTSLGLELIEDGSCPLCETTWVEDELREFLLARLETAKEVDEKLKTLTSEADYLSEKMKEANEYLKAVRSMIPPLKLFLLMKPISLRISRLSRRLERFKDPFGDKQKLNELIEEIDGAWLSDDTETVQVLREVQEAIEKLPDESAEAAAKKELLIASNLYSNSVSRKAAFQEAKRKHSISEQISTQFHTTASEQLTAIYEAVSADFTKFYRSLNRGDEDDFEGELVTEGKKLNFNVDFYDRGKYPPGAFHSEGHQDGMGLCLYLALAKHTLGERFDFSVLDDVLMSVDTGHRREVCRLLTREFPNTQFILTTHDKVWLHYMRSEGLIRDSQLFSGWSVETGPKVWDDSDVWESIDKELEQDKTSEAASLLRRYLEHVGYVLSDGLRAPVRFRADGRYDLGDLLPAGLSRAQKQLKRAEQAAKSWENETKEKEIGEIRSKFAKVSETIQVDYWLVNPLVHYNEWSNFTSSDFKTLADSYKELIGILRCDNCTAFLHTHLHRGKEVALSCSCQTMHYGLSKKRRVISNLASARIIKS